MEILSAILALCEGNQSVTVGFPYNWSGARLAKAYDVTIQRYRNSRAK